MEVNHIIVQAGGKGTRMGYLTYNKPKALVQVDNLPMIFHLFRKFPKCKFYVIGDYQYEVLKRYLEAFAEVEYEIIDARGKKGTCAGIAEALRHIPSAEPFMLIWSDLILPQEYTMPDKLANYIGISKDFKCRWKYENNTFVEESSETQGVAGQFIFKQKGELEGLPLEGEFVRWLKEHDKVFSELPLYKTKEYGILAEYQQLPKQRCRPFNRIRIEGDKLIKEPVDEQGRMLAKREVAWYQKVKDSKFENIPHIYSTQPLIMEKINGENIYEYDLTFEEKKDVLNQLIACIRKIHALESCASDVESYREAYIGKTFKRLEKVYNLVPFAHDERILINGVECKNVFQNKEKLEALVMRYLPDKFMLLHGDCTFSNMMMREGKVPVMIDPRGYFGNTELYGDAAYDWVKLYYSVVGNYDQFNLKRFQLQINQESVSLQMESNHWEEMEDTFFAILGDEVTKQQMILLHAITWLSLTTYAWEDYDSICGAFYNGISILNQCEDF